MAHSHDHSHSVLYELRHHAPFTLLGALAGIVFMFIFRNISNETAHILFMVFHPGHVVLSGFVTAALYKRHRRRARFWVVLLIGYVGSIGVATMSDCVIPYFGEKVFGLHIPTHADAHGGAHESADVQAGHEHTASCNHDEQVIAGDAAVVHGDDADGEHGHIIAGAGHEHGDEAIDEHEHEHGASCDHDGHTAVPDAPELHDHGSAVADCQGHGQGHLHLGFIEEWYLVNPAALVGIFLAFFIPKTEFPHALHVLISTWASSAHILMTAGKVLSLAVLGGMIPVLFLAVWLPCCLSDIVFPTLFLKKDADVKSSGASQSEDRPT